MIDPAAITFQLPEMREVEEYRQGRLGVILYVSLENNDFKDRIHRPMMTGTRVNKEDFEELVAAGIAIKMPEPYLDREQGRICFESGRNRTEWLCGVGVKEMPVMVDKDEAQDWIEKSYARPANPEEIETILANTSYRADFHKLEAYRASRPSHGKGKTDR